MIKKFSLLLLLVSAMAFAAAGLSPDAVIKDAARYDGKGIVVVGTVKEYTEKTSKKGLPYTVFKLAGAKSTVNVYLKGRPTKSPKDGDKVEVSGIFRKEKKLKVFTVTNEIDASAEKGKPYGVKPAK